MFRTTMAASMGLALVLVAPGAVLAQSETIEPARTILVSGVGQSSAEPDEAVVRFGVTARAPSAKAAMRKSARSMDAVIDSLVDAGVDQGDIKTVRLDLRQFREREDGEVVATGWRVDNAVRATVRDIDSTSDVIDAAVAAGVTHIDNVRFRASDPSVALAEARVAAIESASTAASTLAEASGLEVLGVLRIVEGDAGSPATYGRWVGDTAGPQAFSATPIEPGTVDVSSSVSVEYELG